MALVFLVNTLHDTLERHHELALRELHLAYRCFGGTNKGAHMTLDRFKRFACAIGVVDAAEVLNELIVEGRPRLELGIRAPASLPGIGGSAALGGGGGLRGSVALNKSVTSIGSGSPPASGTRGPSIVPQSAAAPSSPTTTLSALAANGRPPKPLLPSHVEQAFRQATSAQTLQGERIFTLACACLGKAKKSNAFDDGAVALSAILDAAFSSAAGQRSNSVSPAAAPFLAQRGAAGGGVSEELHHAVEGAMEIRDYVQIYLREVSRTHVLPPEKALAHFDKNTEVARVLWGFSEGIEQIFSRHCSFAHKPSMAFTAFAETPVFSLGRAAKSDRAAAGGIGSSESSMDTRSHKQAEMEPTMSRTKFLNFCSEFMVVPQHVSQESAIAAFHSIAQRRFGAQDAPINIDGFMEALTHLAWQAAAEEEPERWLTAQNKVHHFFSSIISASFITVFDAPIPHIVATDCIPQCEVTSCHPSTIQVVSDRVLSVPCEISGRDFGALGCGVWIYNSLSKNTQHVTAVSDDSVNFLLSASDETIAWDRCDISIGQISSSLRSTTPPPAPAQSPFTSGPLQVVPLGEVPASVDITLFHDVRFAIAASSEELPFRPFVTDLCTVERRTESVHIDDDTRATIEEVFSECCALLDFNRGRMYRECWEYATSKFSLRNIGSENTAALFSTLWSTETNNGTADHNSKDPVSIVSESLEVTQNRVLDAIFSFLSDRSEGDVFGRVCLTRETFTLALVRIALSHQNVSNGESICATIRQLLTAVECAPGSVAGARSRFGETDAMSNFGTASFAAGAGRRSSILNSKQLKKLTYNASEAAERKSLENRNLLLSGQLEAERAKWKSRCEDDARIAKGLFQLQTFVELCFPEHMSLAATDAASPSPKRKDDAQPPLLAITSDSDGMTMTTSIPAFVPPVSAPPSATRLHALLAEPSLQLQPIYRDQLLRLIRESVQIMTDRESIISSAGSEQEKSRQPFCCEVDSKKIRADVEKLALENEKHLRRTNRQFLSGAELIPGQTGVEGRISSVARKSLFASPSVSPRPSIQYDQFSFDMTKYESKDVGSMSGGSSSPVPPLQDTQALEASNKKLADTRRQLWEFKEQSQADLSKLQTTLRREQETLVSQRKECTRLNAKLGCLQSKVEELEKQKAEQLAQIAQMHSREGRPSNSRAASKTASPASQHLKQPLLAAELEASLRMFNSFDTQSPLNLDASAAAHETMDQLRHALDAAHKARAAQKEEIHLVTGRNTLLEDKFRELDDYIRFELDSAKALARKSSKPALLGKRSRTLSMSGRTPSGSALVNTASFTANASMVAEAPSGISGAEGGGLLGPAPVLERVQSILASIRLQPAAQGPHGGGSTSLVDSPVDIVIEVPDNVSPTHSSTSKTRKTASKPSAKLAKPSASTSTPGAQKTAKGNLSTSPKANNTTLHPSPSSPLQHRVSQFAGSVNSPRETCPDARQGQARSASKNNDPTVKSQVATSPKHNNQPMNEGSRPNNLSSQHESGFFVTAISSEMYPDDAAHGAARDERGTPQNGCRRCAQIYTRAEKVEEAFQRLKNDYWTLRSLVRNHFKNNRFEQIKSDLLSSMSEAPSTCLTKRNDELQSMSPNSNQQHESPQQSSVPVQGDLKPPSSNQIQSGKKLVDVTSASASGIGSSENNTSTDQSIYGLLFGFKKSGNAPTPVVPTPDVDVAVNQQSRARSEVGEGSEEGKSARFVVKTERSETGGRTAGVVPQPYPSNSQPPSPPSLLPGPLLDDSTAAAPATGSEANTTVPFSHSSTHRQATAGTGDSRSAEDAKAPHLPRPPTRSEIPPSASRHATSSGAVGDREGDAGDAISRTVSNISTSLANTLRSDVLGRVNSERTFFGTSVITDEDILGGQPPQGKSHGLPPRGSTTKDTDEKGANKTSGNQDTAGRETLKAGTKQFMGIPATESSRNAFTFENVSVLHDPSGQVVDDVLNRPADGGQGTPRLDDASLGPSQAIPRGDHHPHQHQPSPPTEDTNIWRPHYSSGAMPDHHPFQGITPLVGRPSTGTGTCRNAGRNPQLSAADLYVATSRPARLLSAPPHKSASHHTMKLAQSDFIAGIAIGATTDDTQPPSTSRRESAGVLKSGHPVSAHRLSAILSATTGHHGVGAAPIPTMAGATVVPLQALDVCSPSYPRQPLTSQGAAASLTLSRVERHARIATAMQEGVLRMSHELFNSHLRAATAGRDASPPIEYRISIRDLNSGGFIEMNREEYGRLLAAALLEADQSQTCTADAAAEQARRLLAYDEHINKSRSPSPLASQMVTGALPTASHHRQPTPLSSTTTGPDPSEVPAAAAFVQGTPNPALPCPSRLKGHLRNSGISTKGTEASIRIKDPASGSALVPSKPKFGPVVEAKLKKIRDLRPKEAVKYDI